VVAANDAVAIETIRAAQQAGLSVPRDLSVVGYDDIDLARFVTPQLTTMAVDKLGMGRLALTILLHRLEFPGDALVQAVVRTSLVERGSVANRAGAPGRPPAGTEVASA
jgi:LacI family transcriptional regulator